MKNKSLFPVREHRISHQTSFQMRIKFVTNENAEIIIDNYYKKISKRIKSKLVLIPMSLDRYVIPSCVLKQEPQEMRLKISLQKLKMARNKKRMWMFGKTINITCSQILCRSVKIN